ncbi:hypothetical protein VNO77_44784 [Canavalia gladiata]|uniref:Uncharacterized protein n=1 Tax=Canavalia gladiata TaxID=3824 RepID=A0AAN9JWN2_CANGL
MICALPKHAKNINENDIRIGLDMTVGMIELETEKDIRSTKRKRKEPSRFEESTSFKSCSKLKRGILDLEVGLVQSSSIRPSSIRSGPCQQRIRSRKEAITRGLVCGSKAGTVGVLVGTVPHCTLKVIQGKEDIASQGCGKLKISNIPMCGGYRLDTKYLGDGPKLVKDLSRIVEDLSPPILFIVYCQHSYMIIEFLLSYWEYSSQHALPSDEGALYGVDMVTGGIVNSFANFVWKLGIVKINVINAATEAACLVLSVDETIQSQKIPKERLLQVPWVVEVVEMHSVVEDEEWGDNKKGKMEVTCIILLLDIWRTTKCLFMLS